MNSISQKNRISSRYLRFAYYANSLTGIKYFSGENYANNALNHTKNHTKSVNTRKNALCEHIETIAIITKITTTRPRGTDIQAPAAAGEYRQNI